MGLAESVAARPPIFGNEVMTQLIKGASSAACAP